MSPKICNDGCDDNTENKSCECTIRNYSQYNNKESNPQICITNELHVSLEQIESGERGIIIGELATENIDNLGGRCACRERFTSMKGVFVATLLFTAIATPIGVLLRNTFASKKAQVNMSQNEDFSIDALKESLISNDIATETKLENSSSPQSKALSWISERKIVHKDLYILATLSFGLNEDNDTNPGLLEDDEDWCQWSWVGCTNGEISSVEISSKELTGTIVSEIKHLKGLKQLDLGNNKISGMVPSEVGSLLSLERLNLKNNDFAGSIPDDLWTLKRLQKLDLGGNGELQGTIPLSVTAMTALEILDVTDCSIHGSIPTELGAMSGLQDISLGSNRNLNGTIPTELGQLSNLKKLDIANCAGISGTIPTEIGQMEKLEEINLGYNRISGTIPTEVGNIANLTAFTTMANPLEGSIPTEFGNLLLLEIFMVENSSLSGSIPTEFGMLSNLERFEASKNRITGTIPAEMGNMNRLDEVGLCSNGISGPVPDKWCRDKSIFVRYDCACCQICV